MQAEIAALYVVALAVGGVVGFFRFVVRRGVAVLWRRFSLFRVLCVVFVRRRWLVHPIGLYTPLWTRARVLALKDGDYELARVCGVEERHYDAWRHELGLS